MTNLGFPFAEEGRVVSFNETENTVKWMGLRWTIAVLTGHAEIEIRLRHPSRLSLPNNSLINIVPARVGICIPNMIIYVDGWHSVLKFIRENMDLPSFSLLYYNLSSLVHYLDTLKNIFSFLILGDHHLSI